jgi:hypothetical protein
MSLFCMGVKLVSHTEGRTLRVFQNRVLRRIFGPKGGRTLG